MIHAQRPEMTPSYIERSASICQHSWEMKLPPIALVVLSHPEQSLQLSLSCLMDVHACQVPSILQVCHKNQVAPAKYQTETLITKATASNDI